MNFAGIGPAELLLVLIVALLVFGPQKLPQIAKDLGKTIGEWRQALDEMQSVGDLPAKEIKEVLDPASIERELQESVQRVVEPLEEVRKETDDIVVARPEDAEEPEV